MTAIQDPIAFELFKNALFSIADEMALTITRTTSSHQSRNRRPQHALHRGRSPYVWDDRAAPFWGGILA